MEKLDRIDRKILFYLDGNARSSLSDIARAVKLGRDLVSYRLESYVSRGILSRCRAVIDPGAIGYTIFKTYLKVRNQPAAIRKLVAGIRSHDQTLCYALADGSWDLIFNMVYPTVHEFADGLERLLAAHHELILKKEVAVVLHQRNYPRKFLAAGSLAVPLCWDIGRPLPPVPLDEMDRALLNLLSAHARSSIVDLAKALRSTPIVVRRRIEQLEESRVIVGYRVDLDRRKLGMTMLKGQISFRSDASVRLAQFRTFADRQPNIVSYMEQLGSCRIECNIVTESYDEGVKIIDELREEFTEEVESTTLLLVREEEFCLFGRGERKAPLLVEAA
jgi:Lrp/AsnC family leucine-responsive transcriptional regulator